MVSAYENKILFRRDPDYVSLAKKLNSSFSQFVDYVVMTTSWCDVWSCSADYHWMPYVSRCAFCAVDYDVVGKVETFDSDVTAFFQLANLTAPSRFEANVSPKEADKAAKYFSMLSAEQKASLFKIYELDFKLFGYSAHEYV